MENILTVEKEGIEDQMPATVWEAIGGPNNKYGWRLVASVPPEVKMIAHKKTLEMAKVNEELDPAGDTVIKELKPKGRPKK